MIKAVKVLNVVSIFLFTVILLLVYAYLPIRVELNIDQVGTVHKQHFFYYALVTFVVINLLLRLVFDFGFRTVNENLKAWLKGLLFILNLNLAFLIGFIGVLNNSTHISPSSYAYLNYFGPFLIISWFVGLIFLALRKS